MTSSPHQWFRCQLDSLATDAPILRSIEIAAGQCSWWQQGSTWRRVYGRFHPGREPYASLVFESERGQQTIFHVDVFESRPAESNPEALVFAHPTLGWIRALLFPSDPTLTTIRSLLALHPDATVLRYRPGRRCTVRFRKNGLVFIAKIYPERFRRTGRGEQIHADAIGLWRAAGRSELSFAVARPVSWDPRLLVLRHEQFEGDNMRAQLFEPGGEYAAHQLGQAAGSLTYCRVHPARGFDYAAQLEASRSFGSELISRVPRLTPVVTDLLAALSKVDPAAQPVRPIHGDLEPGQWLRNGTRLCLLDFDEFALGHPELDVATFLHELELEACCSARVRSLSGAFLAGYESIAGPLQPVLLTAYLAHKRLFRALTLARALRPDGDHQAERILQRAFQRLLRHSSGVPIEAYNERIC